MTKQTYRLAVLFLFCLLPLVSSYSVKGKWRLEYDPSFKSISSGSTIVFDFEKIIVNQQITQQLQIYACSILTYTFSLHDQEIFLKFKNIGINRTPCQSEELSEFRKLLDRVTFTVTIADNMLLVSPAGNIVFKLTKIKERRLLTNIAGIWDIFEVQGAESLVVGKANSTQLQFCQGNAQI